MQQIVSYDTRRGERRAVGLPLLAGFTSYENILDGGKNIWVGTATALVSVEKSTGVETIYPLPEPSRPATTGRRHSVILPPYGEGENGIRGMALADGRIWLARQGVAALEVFDLRTERFRTVPLPGRPFPDRIVAHGKAVWVSVDGDNLFSSGRRRLLLYSTSARRFRFFSTRTRVYEALPNGELMYVEDRSELPGEQPPALRILDPVTFKSRPVDPKGLLSDICDIYAAPSGAVWLTYPGGVARLSPDDPRLLTIKLGDRVRPQDRRHHGDIRGPAGVGRYVYGRSEDPEGNLWFSDIKTFRVSVIRPK